MEGRVPTRGTPTRTVTVIEGGEGAHKGRPYADGDGDWGRGGCPRGAPLRGW